MAETATTRAQPARKNRFDTVERERIRAAMQRYMEAHRIGVPTLQARISEAADRPIDLIPLKTLQRFLAGATRTNDAFLIPCHRFASSLPDYGGVQEAGPEALTGILGQFFKSPERTGLKPPEGAAGQLAGCYEAFVGRTEGAQKHPKGWQILTKAARVTFSLPVARITFDRAADSPSVPVTEEVFNPARHFPFDIRAAQERHLYDGVLLEIDSLIFIVLRNTATRLPKAYWLGRVGDALAGSGIETRFVAGRTGRFPLLIDSADYAFFRPEETGP